MDVPMAFPPFPFVVFFVASFLRKPPYRPKGGIRGSLGSPLVSSLADPQLTNVRPLQCNKSKQWWEAIKPYT
jgi:hypothetical protein